MNIKRVATSLAAITILAGAPAFAFADTSAPITVNNVQLTPVDLDNGSGSGAVSVKFTNTSNMTATEVVFALDSGATQVGTFYADGSFAPGATVEQTFEATDDVSNGQIKVQEIKFADGSVWAPADN